MSKELDVLTALANFDPGEQKPSGLGSILGRDLVNLPSKAASSLIGGLNDLANLGAPAGEKPAPWQVPNIMNEPVVNSQSSGMEKIAHIITGSVAPEIAALAVPYVGASKIGEIAGLGAKGASLLGDIGAGMVSGAPRGPEGVGEDAALFAGTNLALSGLGALYKTFRKAKIPPEIANLQPKVAARELPIDAVIPPVNKRAPRLPTSSADVSGPVINIPGRVVGPSPDLSLTTAPTVEGNILNDYTVDSLLQQRSVPQIHPQLIPRPIMMDRIALPDPRPIIPVEEINNPKGIGLQDLEIQQNPAKSKIQSLPEYRRTEGGGIAPEDFNLFGTLLLSGGLGAAGAYAGGKATGTQEGMMSGAAIGLVAPWLGASLLAKSRGEAGGLFNRWLGKAEESGAIVGPAWKLPNGHIVKGVKGQAHWDLMDQIPNTINPMQLQDGFINDAGEFLTRREANDEALLESQINKQTHRSNNKVRGLMSEDLNTAGSIGGGGGMKLPAGESNLTASIEKNIADARMMQPDNPEGFLRKMADMSLKKGDQQAADNFEAAIASLQKKTLTPGSSQYIRAFGNDKNLEGQIEAIKNETKPFGLTQSSEELNKIKKAGLATTSEGFFAKDRNKLTKGIAEYRKIINSNLNENDYHRSLGKLLGYSDKEIEEFIKPEIASLQKKIPDVESQIANLQKQTETPAFKEWFGKSVTVDEKGEPKVYYHGTSKDADFRTFKIGGRGTFFTDSPESASKYAEENDSMKLVMSNRVKNGTFELDNVNTKSRVIPAYLKIENPYKVTEADMKDYKLRQNYAKWQKDFTTQKLAQGYDAIDYGNGVISVLKPNQIKSAIGNSGAFSLKSNDITGSVGVHVLLPIVGVGLGAATGYKENGLEGGLAGAIVGGTLGLGGARLLDRLHITGPTTEAVAAAKTVKSSVETGLKSAFNTSAKDLAGQDVYGRGGILPKFFRAAESLFNFGLPAELHSIITRARGFASDIVEHARIALKSAIEYNPPEEITAITNKFLNGKIMDDAPFLQGKGAITSEAFSRLDSTAKEELSSWTKADGTKLYVKSSARDKFLTLTEQEYLKQLPEEWHDFANLQITMRRSMNQFQKLIGAALPESLLKEKILDSIGRYVPRMYRIFGDNKYHVSDQQIEAASKEFGLSKSQAEIQAAISSYKARPTEDHNKLIAELSQKKDLKSQIRMERLAEFQPVTVDQKHYFASKEVVDSLAKYSNEDYLKNEVRAYLADIKTNRDVYGVAKGIDKTLFMEREDIGPAWRDMLGEYTDSTERMAMGLQKMYAPAQAARLISMVKGMEIDGLPISLSGDDWAAMNTKFKSNSDIANLQKLNAYKKLASDIKFGEYSGLYVNRYLADYFANDSKLWETSLGRNMASFNKIFKTTHVPLNPVSQLRQIFSVPMFAVIGRATPASMGQAWEAIQGRAPELASELIREGIWTADFIRGELGADISKVLNGRYDSDIVKKLKGVYNNILELYRKPDMLTRGGTYLAEKNRALMDGLTGEEAIKRAVEWTDRYSMNYDNLNRATRIARNIPFVNPFISFQSEILRIMKNLAVDSSKGNIERLAVLGGIIALPELAMKTAEGSLSPSDKKEWEKMKVNLPAYMRDTYLLPTGRLANGKFKYVSISPIVPHDNFIQSVKAIAANDPEALKAINPFLSSSNSPLFNLITEAVTGESRQTGLKYRDTREQLSSMVSEILPPLAPGGYEWNKLANVNVENLRSGKVEDWGNIALRYTTGLSSGVLQPGAVMKSAQGRLKSDIANLRAYYLQVAKTTSPNEEKAKAYNEYREGVMLLVHDFASKFAQ